MTDKIYEHLREMAPHHASFSERERLSIILLSDAKREIDRLRLTDEERAAIIASQDVWAHAYTPFAETLRGLLERLK